MPEKTLVKLWVDSDINAPSEDWIWAKSYIEAKDILLHQEVIELNIAYDLGESKDQYGFIRTGYDVLLLIISRKRFEKVSEPKEIKIHCENIADAEKMQGIIQKYLK